jgi:hypothetical protein
MEGALHRAPWKFNSNTLTAAWKHNLPNEYHIVVGQADFSADKYSEKKDKIVEIYHFRPEAVNKKYGKVVLQRR